LLALRDSTSRTAGIVPDVSCLGTRPCLVFGVVYTLVGYILLAGILHPGYPAAGIMHRYLGISRTLVMPGAVPCIPMYPAAGISRTWYHRWCGTWCSWYIGGSCSGILCIFCILLQVPSIGTWISWYIDATCSGLPFILPRLRRSPSTAILCSMYPFDGL